ncbi:MAG: insulinase family protein [Clostridiales bacterium]|nr:insulinase family protein [Clostridiales bacterium]
MEVNDMKIQYTSSYELLYEENLDDLNSLGAVLVHKKTGAKVALISNDDDNKVFYIGFRTPPADSTGVAHIIEHSVLCGSKNFPAKDPFVELAKGSLNTFLNAMTYPDKTVYPIASTNNQDFKNLMHVYMDAVLYPNIYERKEIFQQEGWHYEIDEEDGQLKLNGVVYNEMKGVFSSPESMLNRMIQKSLFPDTPYGVESGGDPDFIPDLSYEQFLDFHKTYYHPSNSYIYLYGAMDFKERLEWLDQEYLSKFDYLEVDSEIALQNSFPSVREVVDYYSIGKEEDPNENTYLSKNIVIGNSLDKELALTFQILSHVLLDAPGAPIKQALLDAGVGKDILGYYEDEILQPTFNIIAKNSEENKKNQFIGIIRDTLSKLVAEGVYEKSLRAAINFYEFRYREADFGRFPKGLIYGLRIMGSWLHDDEKAFLHLKDNAGYAFLKEQIGTGYYETIIQKYLLDNTHSSIVILKPKVGLNEEKDKQLREKLASYKASLAEEEIQMIVEESKKLKLYQEIPSTKEELEKIPMITREDISKKIQPLYNDELTIDGVKVIHHNVYTNQIAYLQLLFDIRDIPQELLPYASLLSQVMGYMNTQNYSYLELSNEINIHTGGISTNVKSYAKKDSTQQYYPVFEFSTKVLYDKLPEAFRLIGEMLFNTVLKDTKRLKEIIDELKSKMQMYFNSSGHSVAVDRAMSYYSVHGLFKDITTGISFYQFLEDLSANFSGRVEKTIENMQQLLKMIFTRNKMLVSITADEEGCKRLKEEFSAFLNRLEQKPDPKLYDAFEKVELVPICKNEGFKAAMQVQYVARVGNFMKAGFDYHGSLRVLKTILSYDYLWNNVRVKGGAYGCMCGFSGVDGDAYFTSYRDPNLYETNHIYEQVVDYIKNFTADERDITKYIIGTFSSLDTPLTPMNKGKRSLSMYLAGITEADLQREREEILSVTEEDIRSLHRLVKAVLDAGYICVIGNESKIEQNKELFKTTKSLMK